MTGRLLCHLNQQRVVVSEHVMMFHNSPHHIVEVKLDRL